MYLNVLGLGALAIAMIRIAERLRGRMSYSDAFFPLALLHLGDGYNLLFGWQVAFFLPTLLSCSLLLVIVGGDAQSRLGSAILAGICLVLLPLCGGHGLLLVPPLALWLGYIGAQHCRSGRSHGRRNGLLILGLVSSALLLVMLDLLDRDPSYGAMPISTSDSRLWATVQSSLWFLGQSFGPRFWILPEWGLKWILPQRVVNWIVRTIVRMWMIPLGVASLLLFSTAALVKISRCRPQERPRTLGLLLYLGGLVTVALAIGYGRPGELGLAHRYCILAAPALFCAYYVWSIYGPKSAGLIIRNSLFLCSLAMLIPNMALGVGYGRYIKHMTNSFEKDLLAGVPNFILASRYAPVLVSDTEYVHHHLEMLHRAGIGKYRFMRADPDFRAISLAVGSAASHRMESEGGIARPTGADPYLEFTLPEATFVAGIRMKYSHPTGGHPSPPLYPGRGQLADQRFAPEPFRISWQRGEQASFTNTQSLHSGLIIGNPVCSGPQEEVATVWVGETLRQFRIQSDPGFIFPNARPADYRISEIELLVPVSEQSGRHTRGDGYGEVVWEWPVHHSDALKSFLRDVISGVH